MLKINNTLIIYFFSIYVILTSIQRITGIQVIKLVIFGLTVGIILVLFKYIINNQRLLNKTIFLFSILLISNLIISLLVNYDQTKISFTIKYFGIIIFLLSGYIITLSSSTTIVNNMKRHKKLIFIIIFIPIIVYFFDLLIRSLPESSSIFANRNNAVLYGVISSYFIFFLYDRILLFFSFVYLNIIVYTTLGALLASVVSYFFIYLGNLTPKKLFKISIAIIFFTIIVYYLFNYSNLHIIERLKSSIRGFEYLLNLNSLEAMANVSYGNLAHQIGSDDLSFLFRIKHWFNIIIIHNNSDLIYWLFGHGNDSIITLTKAELRAHNDYIRLLFEVGIIYLIVFISFNIYLLKRIGLNIYAFPFLIVLLYFFTENLIDNFLAMSLLYYFVGSILALKEKGEILK